MKFTRKYGVLRMLVGCVDYTLIPSGSTIFIKDGFYRLKFRVEHPVDVGDNEDDAPRSPPPDDEADDEEESADKGKGKGARDGTKDDMITEEASKESGGKDGGGAAAAEPMQEALLGANSPQLALNNVSGVIFSPLLKKQFAMVKQQLLERVTSKQEVSDMHTVQGVLVRLHAMMTVLRGSELLKLMG